MRAKARVRSPLRTLSHPVFVSLLALTVVCSYLWAVRSADARPAERPAGPGLDVLADPDRVERDRARTAAQRERQAGRARLAHARARSVQAWSGHAFDACRAPSSRVMDRWRVASPFLGVGVYIGGPLRACPQKHLTRRWVARQTGRGWRLLPIWVGPQARCTGYSTRISARPTVAGRQGAHAARGALGAARRLGIPAGSTLWYDLEWFPVRHGGCRATALRFLGSWTRTLHGAGYRSGVYSSVSAGIKAVGKVRGRPGYAHPDAIWFAWANGRRDTSLGNQWVRAPRWRANQRVHQYALDVRASYGGVRMAIDRNYVDLGGSLALRRAPAVCGRDADRSHYRRLNRGDRGAVVRTANCLLDGAGHLRGRPSGRFDGRSRAATLGFQRRVGLPRTGRVNERTWTALLAAGARPVLKRGSEGPAVRRLQRSLTAALPGSVSVHGHFGPATTSAVQHYQRRAGLPATGVAAGRTWQALGRGTVHHAKQGLDHAKRDRRHAKPGKHDAKPGKHDAKPGKHHGKPKKHHTKPDKHHTKPDKHHTKPDKHHTKPDKHRKPAPKQRHRRR